MVRDGWQRRGDNYGTRQYCHGNKQIAPYVGDDGWQSQPTPKHPVLTARFLGYLKRREMFEYCLEGHEELLDKQVDCAAWDSLGNLIFSRLGVLHKLSLEQIKRKEPGSVHDLESLKARAAS